MKTSFLPVATVVVLSACGRAGADNDGSGGGFGGGFAMPVEVAIAVTDTVVDEIVAVGEVEAVQAIELRPEVEGRLVDIMVREGTEVARGTPLFKVDDAELRAQVARLQADLDLAEQALARTRELIERNASATADLELAQANARSARAQLQLQQVRLNRTVVRAPFAGIVGERLVSIGDYLTTSSRLTTLQTVDPQRAAFRIPERYADKLAVGQQVTFRVAASQTEFTGIVDFVNPVVQLPGRTITVKASVPDPDRALKPGMFIEARLATDIRGDAVVIPEDAVLPLQGVTLTWVIVDGTATRREVELGVRTPGFVEILSGVESGEQVVVGGLERLSEGAQVNPILVERGRSSAR